MQKRYNAEIVAGALLPNESRVIAKLMLEGVTSEEFERLLNVENILQKRSPATARRKTELINKRLQLIDKKLLLTVANGTRQSSNQALLVAAIKHSRLIGDFLLRIVKEKWRVFDTTLKPIDWENFLAECEQIDETVTKWKTSTREKLGQVVKKCLVEAGYLESAFKPVITPVILMPEIRNYLIEHQENYVLDCMSLVT
jgi:hypothetical protein